MRVKTTCCMEIWESLVGVLYESPVAFGQVGHDDSVALVHHPVDMLRTPARRRDGRMDNDAQRMPIDEVEAPGTGKDVETAVDGDGHDGKLQGIGELEGTAAEGAHVSVVGTGTFGEDAERGSAGKGFSRVSHRLQYGTARTLVDENKAGLTAGEAHKGDVAEAFLHHPLEFVAKIAVDGENIERPLVVRHENVALPTVDVLLSLDGDGNKEQAQQSPCPKATDILGGKGGETDDGEQGNEQTGKDCKQKT